MEIKRAIKKIIALGTGATMVGATVLGAMATADLANYPAPFVEDGIWNAVSIIGAKSSAEDNVAITDVVLGLAQVEVGTTSATSATTSLEGDAYQISKSSDELNLFEYLSADSGSGELANGPIGTVTKSELNALADGSITNEKGTFTYNQYIIMPENASIVYDVDSDVSDDPALYLKFVDASLGYLYRLSFASALKSDIDSADDFDDLDNKKISMLGKEFTIIDTDNSTGEIDLMAGAVQDTLTEGESKTYTINGIDYETEVIIITDVTNSQVKFKINGETTDALLATETFKLADGTEIGIKEILPNEAGDVTQDLVEFYLGAEKITLTDALFGTANWAGTLTVSGEDVSNVYLDIVGTFPSSGTDVSISKLDINWTAGDDYFVPIGGKLSDQLEADQKDQLFLNNLDFEFTGVDFGETEEIKIRAAAADKMKVSVPTKTGGDLNFYAFYSLDNTSVLLGKSADRPLITDAGIPINKNYQFIVSSGYYSHLLEATYFDTTNTRVTFKDVGLGTSFKVTANTEGTFYLDGYAYTFTANYDNGEANFTSFVSGNDAEGEIWTPSEAKVKISVFDNTTGLVEFTEYRKGPGDGAAADVKHVNVTITDAGSASTEKITTNSPTSNDANFAMTSWDSETNYLDGYTRWGTHVEYETPTGGQNPVTITYPISEATADVYVTSGVVSTSTTAAGEAGIVYAFVDIGSVMRDVEVADWKATNVIVVGGPCVNTVAAELLESDPANCAVGFEEGKAKIKLFEVEDKVALLVAGMTGADTKRAGLVLKDYATYEGDLAGMEVEMTATSDSDIALAAPVVEEPVVEEPVVE